MLLLNLLPPQKLIIRMITIMINVIISSAVLIILVLGETLSWNIPMIAATDRVSLCIPVCSNKPYQLNATHMPLKSKQLNSAEKQDGCEN